MVFETSGSEEGIRSSVDLVEPGGTVVLIGIPHTDIPISIASVVREQVRVIGSLIYDHPGDFKDTIDLLAAHTVTSERDPRSAVGLCRRLGRDGRRANGRWKVVDLI